MKNPPQNPVFSTAGTSLSLQMDGTEIEHDVFDYMQAYVQEAFPEKLTPLPGNLLTQLCLYLQSLTDAPTPPSPELVNAYLSYLEPQAQQTARLGDFAHFKGALQTTLESLSGPLLFEPASPEFIETTIQKVVIGRDPTGIGDSLLLTLKALAKRLELTLPSSFNLIDKAFARRGDFHVCQVDEFLLTKSFPLSEMILFEPDRIRSAEVWRLVDTPDITDFVVPSLAGFSFFLTKDAPQKFRSDGSTTGMAHEAPGKDPLGPLSSHVTADFFYLKGSRNVKTTLTVFPLYLRSNADATKDYFLNVAAKVFVTHYYAIVK
ncbi:hypothetical protein [Kiloniella laminariae]|uniref:hypothetical protein n=1 Tax=Kiloniella laminariae TaxID=454162 RepID=UPI000369431A|nr:hypothetical protein [Kiloniella laminariae]